MSLESLLPVILPEVYHAPSSSSRLRSSSKPRRSPLSQLISRLEKKMEDESFDLSDAEDYYEACFDHVASGQASGSRLLQLPPELLTVVVEHCLAHTDDNYVTPEDIECLKTLRRTHPLLAYLRYVRQKLFDTVTLSPDPDHLRILERDTASIAPFVRRIVFRPFIVYRDQFPEARAFDRPDTVRGMMKPRLAAAIESGRVAEIWAQLLRKLPCTTGFYIDGEQRSTWSCVVCGPDPDALLSLAIDAVVASQQRPRELCVSYAADDEFIWTKIDTWDSLGVSSLRKLQLEFTVNSLFRKWDYKKTFRLESAMVVSSLLLRSANTLQQLTLAKDALSCLSSQSATPPPPALPQLKTLNLEGGNVSAQRVSALLRQCTNILHITTSLIDVGMDSSVQEWFVIFAAVKEHPNRLQYHFRGIQVVSAARYARLSLYSQPSTSLHNDSRLDPIGNEITAMIREFICGQGEWKIQERWDPDNYEDSDDDSDPDFEDGFDQFVAEEMDFHDRPDLLEWIHGF